MSHTHTQTPRKNTLEEELFKLFDRYCPVFMISQMRKRRYVPEKRVCLLTMFKAPRCEGTSSAGGSAEI